MEHLRQKLEELCKALKEEKKAAKPKQQNAGAMLPSPESEDHPSSISERDVKGVIAGRKPIVKLAKNGQWSME